MCEDTACTRSSSFGFFKRHEIHYYHGDKYSRCNNKCYKNNIEENFIVSIVFKYF